MRYVMVLRPDGPHGPERLLMKVQSEHNYFSNVNMHLPPPNNHGPLLTVFELVVVQVMSVSG